jgi:hypothetical protein
VEYFRQELLANFVFLVWALVGLPFIPFLLFISATVIWLFGRLG